MGKNAKHSPLKVDGVIVGVCSMDTLDNHGVIHMQLNGSEAAEKIWEMLSDPGYGYSFHDEVADDEIDEMTFQQDLAQVINRHSKETASGTPDFILAAYLEACLSIFEVAINGRADFRGETVEFFPGRQSVVGFYCDEAASIQDPEEPPRPVVNIASFIEHTPKTD